MGGYPRASSSKVSGQMASTEEETGYAIAKRLKQAGQGIPMSTTVVVASMGDIGNPRATRNPSNVIYTKAVIPRTATEITLST